MLEKKWEISQSYKGIELKHERATRLKREGHRDTNIFWNITLSVIVIILIVFFYIFVIKDNPQKSFEKAKNEAMSSDDPFLALDTFRGQIGDYGTYCSFLQVYDDEDSDCDKRNETEKALVLKAIDDGSVPALLFLFDKKNKKPSIYPENLERDKAEIFASRIISLADEAPLIPENQKLLMTAGKILQDGKFTLQNTQKSISMYVRSWQTGDKYAPANRDAAAELTEIYESLKDSQSAYFWRIRSMNIRGGIPDLAGEQIKEIQSQAADKNILYIAKD
ncbi:hypothetical protein AZH90_004338 [Salmonella enterica subsp. enterica serovar Legon]|nr:hypothetical protein [Salmonella enterica subsp. enterica serovar Legon]EDZ3589451.1 hypothetical protein [Salmonella enterica subsp. enterica serovar Wagenia]